MDIRGTIKATLKIFKEDPDKYLLLKPLGMASRYQYDIEDIKTDLANGYINIPQEECDELGIQIEDLKYPNSPLIDRWLLKHAKEGIQFLEEHDQRVKYGNFSMVARATFPLVYAMPARSVFKKTIKLFDGKYKGRLVEDVLDENPGYFGWIQGADFPLYTKKVLTAIQLRKFNK